MSNLAKVSGEEGEETKYLSPLSSPQLHMSGATEESNEKHLAPWSAACHRDNISNTPLSPYMDQELLYNRCHAPSHHIAIHTIGTEEFQGLNYVRKLRLGKLYVSLKRGSTVRHI